MSEIRRSGPGVVHDQFAAVAAAHPGATAVVHGRHRLTYGELAVWSDTVAARLLGAGVAPGELVALAFDRSLAAVAAQLGILKAGGAYVPLDPGLAQEATARLVAEAGIRVAVTDDRAGAPAALRTVSVARDGDTSAPAPVRGLDGASPAYVMFTSGTTGAPKGVVVPHRAILRLAVDADFWRVGADDRVTHISPLAWDAATLELWAPLLNGASLVLYPRETVLSGRAFADAIARDGITKGFLTTSLFHRFARLDPGMFAGMDLIVGGEALLADSVRAVMRSTRPPAGLTNAYGPTENTTFSTTHRLTEPPWEGAEHVPIGRAIGGSTAFLVDEYGGEVTEPGRVAELHVGGAGLALGYLGRPDLTSAAFVEHPRLGRLYRTGDLAFYDNDGALAFAGRRDGQIKLRGYRIEPGGVERLLCEQDGVLGAAVVVRGDGDQRRLVAYVEAARGAVDAVALRSRLAERLSDPIIPAQFFRVDRLPARDNGKVDRAALDGLPAELLDTAPRPDGGLQATEAELRRSLAAVLGCAPDAVERELGALTSLGAAQVAHMLAPALGLRDPLVLRMLVTHPGVHDCAVALHTAQALMVAADDPAPRGVDGRGLAVPSFVSVTDLALPAQIAAGSLPPLDAAALAYMPDLVPDRRAELASWHQGRPVMTHVVDTAEGRIGLVCLPVEDGRLYLERDRLEGLCVDGMELAATCGARLVALTGLLPSALEYGGALARRIAGRTDLPPFTTGHATTTSAVVMNLDRLLAIAGRGLERETLAVIGLGSIGSTSLALAFSVLPHPRHLFLCDVYAPALERAVAGVRAMGFAGPVDVVHAAGAGVPDAVYDRATAVLGATNVAGCLDVGRLRPGTVVVDDSGPHCFDGDAAIARMERARDVLVTEGGEFRVPAPMLEVRAVPDGREDVASLLTDELMIALRRDPHEIMGCLNSALLSAAWELPLTTGLVDVETARRHYDTLLAHGYTAARPHINGYVIPDEIAATFRERFGALPCVTPAAAA